MEATCGNKRNFFIEGTHIIPFKSVIKITLKESSEDSKTLWCGDSFEVIFGGAHVSVVLTCMEQFHDYLVWLNSENYKEDEKKNESKSLLDIFKI